MAVLLGAGDSSEAQKYNTGGLSWLHLFGPTAYNEVRFGYHREHWEEKIQDLTWPGGVSMISRWLLGISDTPCTRSTDLSDYRCSKIQKGNHSLKIGGEIRYWRCRCKFDADVLGEYLYFSGMDWISNKAATICFWGKPPDPLAGNPYVPGDPNGEWKTGFGMTWRKWKGIEAGLFVQDDWSVSDRLTISLGLRWDYYSVPQEISGVGINQPAFGTQQGYETSQIIEGKYNPDNPAEPANREGIQYLMFDGRTSSEKDSGIPITGFFPEGQLCLRLYGRREDILRGGTGSATSGR